MITKQQAHLLAGYDYRLWDVEEKEIVKISGVGQDLIFILREKKRLPFLNISEIGTRYKIVAYPLEYLTKEIEGVGVPVEHFEIGDLGGYNFEFDHGNIKLIKHLKSIAKYNILYDVNYLPAVVKEQLYTWHFDLFPEGTTINPDNI